jgi:hypothetical protein
VRHPRRSVVAVVAVTALAAGLVNAVPPAARATSSTVSQASASLLSGVLDGVDFSTIGALAPATASYPADPGPVVKTISAATLNSLPGALSDGTHIFGSDGLLSFAGPITEVARANADGSSSAAVGAVDSDGTPSVAGTPVTLDMTKLLDNVPGLAAAVSQFKLTLGNLVSSVTQAANGNTVGNLSVSNGVLTMVSPQIADLPTSILDAIGPVTDAVTSLGGSSGAFANAIDLLGPVQTILTALSLGHATTTSSVTSDLAGAVQPLLSQKWTSPDGNVSVTPATGVIKAKLTPAGSSSLGSATQLLPASLQSDILASVDSVLGDLLNTVLSTVLGSLGSSPVSLTSSAGVLGGLLPTGLLVTVTGTLSSVLGGTATGSSALSLLGLSLPLPFGDVLAALASPITSVIGLVLNGGLPDINGGPLDVLNSALTGGSLLSPISSALGGVLSGGTLGGASGPLSMVGNVLGSINGLTSGTGLVTGLPLVGDVLGILNLGSLTTGPNPGPPSGTPPAPRISSLNKHLGPTRGGARIRITGSGFDSTSRVLVAGKALHRSAVTVRKSTLIVFTTPRHGAGSVKVRVRTHSGTSGKAGYHYVARPRLRALPHVCGHTSGGQLLTLHGAHYVRRHTTVHFAHAKKTRFVRFASDRITFRTVKHKAGNVSVYVTTPGGKSPVRSCSITK